MKRKINIQDRFCLFSFLIIVVGYSCNDLLISEDKVLLEQIPGCKSHTLNKSASADPCFFYTFKTELDIQFCVSGNCCPDSNRYALSSRFIMDTLEIAVKDTAMNLCKCICQYFIHTRVQGLERNHYIIKCIQEDSTVEKILYLKEVNRD